MPLYKGSSQETIAKNISKLTEENKGKDKPRPHKQIIAIALEIARKSKK